MSSDSKTWLKSFWVALQFLTIFPVPKQYELDGRIIAGSVLFYPLVGLVVGLILWLVAFLLGGIFSSLVLSAILVLVWVVVTGALHLDGLADCADAWVGGLGSKERTLEIMKDPASGPVAVVSLLVLLLLKFALLEALVSQQAYGSLIFAPLFGRMAAITLLLTTSYVRPGGLGEALSTGLSRRKAWLQIMVIGLLLIFISPVIVLPVLLLTMGTFLLWRWMMMKRLGGCTGDTLGAMIELIELSSLLAIVGLIGVMS